MRKKIGLLCALIVASAILIVWYRSEEVASDKIIASNVTQQPIYKISTVQTPTAQSTTTSVAPKKPTVNRINTDISDNFSVLAKTYANEINYPAYSTPLTNADRQLLEPNSYYAQTIPLENHASASIQLERFRFIYPQPVNVRLQLEKIQVYDVTLSLFDEQNNTLLTTGRMHTDSNGYSATLIAESNWNGPLRIEIEFKSGGQSQIIQTGFEYVQPVAKITGIGSTYTEGPDLIIPVKLKVNTAGYYRLRANLFKPDHQPLAVLTAKAKLTRGDSEIKLRVYKSLLTGHPSPLILGTFQLENRSAAPGKPTRYGDSEKAEFTVEYSTSDIFSEENYQPSEEEKQRLDFLNQMAEKK